MISERVDEDMRTPEKIRETRENCVAIIRTLLPYTSIDDLHEFQESFARMTGKVVVDPHLAICIADDGSGSVVVTQHPRHNRLIHYGMGHRRTAFLEFRPSGSILEMTMRVRPTLWERIKAVFGL